jgi:restriction endonuclease
VFENDIFETWLDEKSKELVKKIGNQEKLSSEEMIILVLKAQSNHFHHLDQDMRKDMKDLREDMNKRFEQVDKRFEQVDKRFEQVDKRFDTVVARMDRFMIWSLGLTMTSTIFILGFMYKLIG